MLVKGPDLEWRIDAIWASCRYKYGNNGNYLFGRFSIADCLFAPIAIVFDGYNAKLSSEADAYMNFLLDNPFVQKWMTLGRRETQELRIANISNKEKLS